MTRHFIPTPSEYKTKKHREQLDRQKISAPMNSSETICYYFPNAFKATETHKTYFVPRKNIDPDVFHEKISVLIPGTTVKADEALPFLIVMLQKPLTSREFSSHTKKILEELS